MIKRLKLVVTQSVNPYANLALEEYLLKQVDEDECILYLWQNQKTVVIGRNQNAWKECRCEELKKEGGYTARRLSGGGAVYHDLGNLNFTFFVGKEDYDVKRQTDVLLHCFKKLGLKAEKTGRNDVVIEGKKVSGHAYYETQKSCYHHGTIMVDVEKEKLHRYLNVNQKKMKSNGVDSVISRVANLTDFDPGITVEKVEETMGTAFEEEYGLPAQKIFALALMSPERKALEEKYASWEWIFGRKQSFENSVEEKYPWGIFQMDYTIKGGRFTEIAIYSDSLYPEVIEYLKEQFLPVNKASISIKYTKEDVRNWMTRAKKLFLGETCQEMIQAIGNLIICQIQ